MKKILAFALALMLAIPAMAFADGRAKPASRWLTRISPRWERQP